MKTALYLTFFIMISSLTTSCAALGIHEDSPRWQRRPSFLRDEDIQLEEERRGAQARLQELESERLEAARENRQLVPGMSMSDVTEILGQPQEVQSAGDPRLGNQRWIYTNGIFSSHGIASSRSVYFENGRVAGWEFGR